MTREEKQTALVSLPLSRAAALLRVASAGKKSADEDVPEAALSS